METSPQISELTALMERFTGRRDGEHPTAIAPLVLYRASASSAPVHNIYGATLCLIAQGRKHVYLMEERYPYDPAHYLLASVDLPVVGQVVEATPRVPYLGLRLDLDPSQISALILEAGLPGAAKGVAPSRGIAVSRLEPVLLAVVVRLLRLLETPQDARVLAPMAIREILYHLLRGEQGERLRQIAADNTQTQRIARAIRYLKQNYAQPFRIEDVAREAYMSPSGLHHHFKAVTAMSPLQYQKTLRLQEARRLMLIEALDAATAGYRVGYDSPSQFSREYRRLFGAPPLRDVARLRSLPPAEIVTA